MNNNLSPDNIEKINNFQKKLNDDEGFYYKVWLEGFKILFMDNYRPIQLVNFYVFDGNKLDKYHMCMNTAMLSFNSYRGMLQENGHPGCVTICPDLPKSLILEVDEIIDIYNHRNGIITRPTTNVSSLI
jgi:hypothetical protein